MEKKYYVYVHRRASDGRPFYVGKGCGRRAFVKYGRGPYWQNIVRKHGYSVVIVKDGMSEVCASSLEKALIYVIGLQNLCNVSPGGDGMRGFVFSAETLEKMRLAKLGVKQSESHAQQSRAAKVGKKQPITAVDKTRKAKSIAVISSDGEVFCSAAEAARVLSSRLGVKCSQANISMCANGLRSNAYGLTWSKDTSKIPQFLPTKFPERKVVCLTTGETFQSVQAAKAWVSSWRGYATNQGISKAARDGTMAYGFKWVYA